MDGPAAVPDLGAAFCARVGAEDFPAGSADELQAFYEELLASLPQFVAVGPQSAGKRAPPELRANAGESPGRGAAEAGVGRDLTTAVESQAQHHKIR